MWNVECGVRIVLRYSIHMQSHLYLKHISLLIPHSTFLKKSLRNLDVLYKVTLAVGFLTIDHEMTA